VTVEQAEAAITAWVRQYSAAHSRGAARTTHEMARASLVRWPAGQRLVHQLIRARAAEAGQRPIYTYAAARAWAAGERRLTGCDAVTALARYVKIPLDDEPEEPTQ
jgi:hypothetical protein